MEERIKKYVDYVFDGAPNNDRTKRTKEMVVSEITEKYDKGISEGKTEEKAYADALAETGDLRKLVDYAKGEKSEPAPKKRKSDDAVTKKESIRLAIASYIIWPIAVCIHLLEGCFYPKSWSWGWAIYLLAAAIYSFIAFLTVKSNYKKREGALTGAIWTLAAFVYFAISFYTGKWNITWCVFVVAVPLTAAVKTGYLKYRKSEETEDDSDEK